MGRSLSTFGNRNSTTHLGVLVLKMFLLTLTLSWSALL